MRFRSISVRKDVYDLLRLLSEVSNMSVSDLIKELITAYQALNEVRDLLRQCLGVINVLTTVNTDNKINMEIIKDSVSKEPRESAVSHLALRIILGLGSLGLG
ncbi:MAG: hypothetical protein ACP5GZ_01190 [Vulcanisaeta sp.]|jgi:predicted CopG family antitoxin|uniref:hypothetical protein n=1 Tax=Vulcanisaeta sp. TaxID=2020871 RepID=UPI003D0CD7E1